MPWGPSNISLMKLRSATQMMGDMSTPPTGWITRLVGPRTGSVGFTTTDQGSLSPGICKCCITQLLQEHKTVAGIVAVHNTSWAKDLADLPFHGQPCYVCITHC